MTSSRGTLSVTHSSVERQSLFSSDEASSGNPRVTHCSSGMNRTAVPITAAASNDPPIASRGRYVRRSRRSIRQTKWRPLPIASAKNGRPETMYIAGR